jgi:hypothetical protein
MASKNVGLIGRGRGPTVFVNGNPKVEVRGLTSGSVEVVALDHEGVAFDSRVVYVDGLHEFIECHSVVFNNPGPCSTVVCSLITGG